MKKAILFFGVILLLLCTIFLGKSVYNETKSTVLTIPMPKFQTISPRQINNDNVISLAIVDKNRIITTLSPKPDIISFNIDQQNNLQISNVFQRDNWQLSDLVFIDSLNGFAVGAYGTILKTSDGGLTWNQLPRFSEYDFQGVSFFNKLSGYVAGRFGVRNEKTQEVEWKVKIFKTEDGGNSWTQSYQGDNESTVFQITVFSPEIALASINGTRLIRTEDGGQKWKDVSYNGRQVTSITFAPDKTFWLVGGKGEFLISKDSGITWQKPDNFPNELHNHNWWSIDFDKIGNGLAVSEGGEIAYTNDTGKTWKKFSQKISEPLRSVKVKDGVGVVLGENNIYKLDF